MAGATTKPGLCQVRIKTDHPCPYRAVTEILGMPLCEVAPASRRRTSP